MIDQLLAGFAPETRFVRNVRLGHVFGQRPVEIDLTALGLKVGGEELEAEPAQVTFRRPLAQFTVGVETPEIPRIPGRISLFANFDFLLMFPIERNVASEGSPTGFEILNSEGAFAQGLFSNIQGIVYYDWENSNLYNFINLQRDFRHFSLYLMAYWNPDDYRIPTQEMETNLYAGRGIQIMFVLNH